jgi:hypothetical protein
MVGDTGLVHRLDPHVEGHIQSHREWSVVAWTRHALVRRCSCETASELGQRRPWVASLVPRRS